MITPQAVDAARLSLLLNELRLPAIKTVWPQFADRCAGTQAAGGAVEICDCRRRHRGSRDENHRTINADRTLKSSRT